MSVVRHINHTKIKNLHDDARTHKTHKKTRRWDIFYNKKKSDRRAYSRIHGTLPFNRFPLQRGID